MRNILLALTVAGLGLTSLPAQAEANKDSQPARVTTEGGKEKNAQPLVQMAILLDTSSSMDGLINQARTQIWKIVNELTLSKQAGKTPTIQIALYEYGNSRLTAKDNYIRQVLPLTDDLDAVSDALFKLKTSGGEEYCGAVIAQAVKELKWDTEDKNALKLIYISGNEPFSQGPVKYTDAISNALKKGITVNTIYCEWGSNDGDDWRAGALKADGSYMAINQDARPADPETPYDKELANLGGSLNGTYLAYGTADKKGKMLARQENQDSFASSSGEGVMAQRAVAKSGGNYKNNSWDAVDAVMEGSLELGDIQEEELPDELKDKTEAEKKEIIETKAKERKEIQEKIQTLAQKRDAWLIEKRKEEGDKPNTLDTAIIEALRKQAEKKNFLFEDKK